MHKSLLVASVTVLTTTVFGMDSRDIYDRGNYSEAHFQEVSDQYRTETSLSSKKRPRCETNEQTKKRKTSNTEIEIDEDTVKKIADYAERIVKCKQGHSCHSYESIKESLMYYCTYPEIRVEDIASKFGVPNGTLKNWIRDTKINRRNPHVSKVTLDKAVKEYIRNGGSLSRAARKFGIEMKTLGNEIKKRSDQGLMLKVTSTMDELAEMKQQISDSYHEGGDFKDFYAIFKRKNNTGEIPEGFNYLEFTNNQDMGNYRENYVKKVFRNLIIPTWSEEKKEQLLNQYAELIKDVREGFLSQKGRSKKYNLRECDDYLLRHIARGKRDVSIIKEIKWNIAYKGTSSMPQKTKKQIIEDYNSGLFTVRGIAKKNQTTEPAVFSVTSEQRNGVKNISTDDIITKSTEYIMENYTVAVDTIRRYKSLVTQWHYLNADQKNIFKDTMKTFVMPNEDDFDRIKNPKTKRNDRVTKDHTKLLKSVLTVLLSKNKSESNKEIAEELNIKQSSVIPYNRAVEIWKSLAEYEEKLIEASKKGDEEVVKNLINKNIDINCKDKEGLTPLHHAIKIQNESLVKLLMESGANVNEKNKNDNTPLMFAVGVKNERLVKYLIDEGANINQKNKKGQTALYVAKMLKLNKIVSILKQAGAK